MVHGHLSTWDRARKRVRVVITLRVIIDYLEGRNIAVPRVFKRSLPASSLKNAILGKKNFCPGTRTNYLVIPGDLRDKI